MKAAPNPQLALPGLEAAIKQLVHPFKFPSSPHEFKMVTLRECPMDNPICDTPERAEQYWRRHIPTDPRFNSEVECLNVLLLNTRRRLRGHHLVSTGLMDSLLIHPREIFRLAIVGSAAAIIVMHNHPSGDPSPSEADIKATRDLIRAGQLMKIELLDHVIIGSPAQAKSYVSLREMGFFNC